MISRRKVLAMAGAMPAWLALKSASSATEAVPVSGATHERAQDSGPLQSDVMLKMGGTPASMMQHFMHSRSGQKPSPRDQRFSRHNPSVSSPVYEPFIPH